MADEMLQKKAKWFSRRGLLELDIILTQFISSPLFNTLTNEELSTYIQILDWQDYDFLETIQGLKSSDDINILNIIRKIRSCSKMSLN